MPIITDEDEFDLLPDIFEGIDWDTIPAVAGDGEEDRNNDAPVPYEEPSSSAVMDQNHAVSDGDANCPAPATVEADAAHHRTSSEQEFELTPAAEPIISRSSSQYSFDDVDGSFLEEVEAIEASFVEPLHGPGTSSM